MKWVIRYCGGWSQMTPWMWGLKFPDGQEILIAGRYMGNFYTCLAVVQKLIKEYE